jgi:hypothetical protein
MEVSGAGSGSVKINTYPDANPGGTVKKQPVPTDQDPDSDPDPEHCIFPCHVSVLLNFGITDFTQSC